MCRNLIFNRAPYWVVQLYQKESPAYTFSCEFHTVSKNTYLVEHLQKAVSIVFFSSSIFDFFRPVCEEFKKMKTNHSVTL